MREALKRTAVALKAAGVPFALGGGYAAWALGGPEPEHDVDFLVAEEAVEQAEQALSDAGLRVERPPEDWLFKAFDGDAMVDLIFRANNAPVDGALLDSACDVEVFSVVMPVLSSTDLVVTKMLALTEHACDFGKVLPSARALREQIEWEQVRRRTSHNPFARSLLFLLAELDIVEGRAAPQPGKASEHG